VTNSHCQRATAALQEVLTSVCASLDTNGASRRPAAPNAVTQCHSGIARGMLA